MEQPDRAEILKRLKLIEDMMAEGRRTTENWGWVFLLWGLGPLTAMLWEARWPYPALAWPSIMAVCVTINGAALRLRKRRGYAETATTRSVGAIWSCAGVTVLVLAIGALWSGVADVRALYVALFAVAALAHSTSSVILRWPPQSLAALVWWLASLAAFAAPTERLHDLGIAALILGNVAFGAWLTYRGWSRGDE